MQSLGMRKVLRNGALISIGAATIMNTGQFKILVVDDSNLVRGLLSDMLSELDGVCTVYRAADAREGLKRVSEVEPDLVTLDIRMPGETGVDLLAKIKTQKDPPEVVILTNYPFPSYRKRCAEHGADHFLDKTTELHKLLEVVRSAIARRNNGGPRAQGNGRDTERSL